MRPIVFEFVGLPYSGKATLISDLAEELTSKGFKVKVIQENTSDSFPRDTWIYNSWSVSNRVQTLLEIPFYDVDIVLLNRGFYDSLFFTKLLRNHKVCSKKQFVALYNYLIEMDASFHLTPQCVFILDGSSVGALVRNQQEKNEIRFNDNDFVFSYKKAFKNFYKGIPTPKCIIDTTNCTLSDTKEIALAHMYYNIKMLAG